MPEPRTYQVNVTIGRGPRQPRPKRRHPILECFALLLAVGVIGVAVGSQTFTEIGVAIVLPLYTIAYLSQRSRVSG